MQPAIRVEKLGKCYRVAHNQLRGRYRTLRDSIVDAAKAPFRRMMNGGGSAAAENFWALNDVSFEVKPGEVVGIIGRNGAGKSTLLKIVARITKPTNGRIELNGRVGSLLEVGTGFHPELTGRENVYLNGSILGMSKREIDRKFDEIVAFAEIEKFLDTPVKRYSSGMYVRLAFAVAAHLELEILIVDEVLAVGDTAFQKKCMGKMGDVARTGKTILFVSHDMNAVTRLCSRALLFDRGAVSLDDSAARVATKYLQVLRTTTQKTWNDLSSAPGTNEVRLRRLRFCDRAKATLETVTADSEFGIEMTFDLLVPGLTVCPNIHCFNSRGIQLFCSLDNDPIWLARPRSAGTYVSTAWIPANLLAEGDLRVSVALTRLEPQLIYFHEEEVIGILVTDSPDTPLRAGYKGGMPGVMRPWLKWTTDAESNLLPFSLKAGV
jgi:lipopolysaccharide transport system ATP-binding protein